MRKFVFGETQNKVCVSVSVDYRVCGGLCSGRAVGARRDKSWEVLCLTSLVELY
jgi:hypothetical protein